MICLPSKWFRAVSNYFLTEFSHGKILSSQGSIGRVGSEEILLPQNGSYARRFDQEAFGLQLYVIFLHFAHFRRVFDIVSSYF